MKFIQVTLKCHPKETQHMASRCLRSWACQSETPTTPIRTSGRSTNDRWWQQHQQPGVTRVKRRRLLRRVHSSHASLVTCDNVELARHQILQCGGYWMRVVLQLCSACHHFLQSEWEYSPCCVCLTSESDMIWWGAVVFHPSPSCCHYYLQFECECHSVFQSLTYTQFWYWVLCCWR